MMRNRKRLYIIQLLRQRDELAGRITRIDEEIDAAWQGKTASNRRQRGRPCKYARKDTQRILALSETGLSERAIAQRMGIPHSTVGRMITKHKGKK